MMRTLVRQMVCEIWRRQERGGCGVLEREKKALKEPAGRGKEVSGSMEGESAFD